MARSYYCGKCGHAVERYHNLATGHRVADLSCIRSEVPTVIDWLPYALLMLLASLLLGWL